MIYTHFPGHILFTGPNTWMLPCILQGGIHFILRVPGEILTVEVYNDYEIACLTSFGAIFVNGNEGSIHYLIEVDDRASLLKEIASYKDKAKERQVIVLEDSQSLSDKEKKLYQKLLNRVDKRLPTYVDVNREPKWLQVLRNITGNDKSLI